MTCDSVRQRLSLFLYGELSFDEEERLEAHVAACAACQEKLERERTLHELTRPALLPPPGLLPSCRDRLWQSIHKQPPAPAPWWQRWVPWRPSVAGNWHAAWPPVAAAALLVIGFVGGRFADNLQVPDAPPAAEQPAPVASKVRYLEPSPNGQVQIVVEETRQRTLSGDMQDEPIRQLLLATTNEARDPGLRVESVELLKPHTESPDVQRALLTALQHDPDPGVRLKALEALKPYSQARPIRQVLATVLLADDSPGVRAQAIDLLIQKREQAMIGVLQELMRREEDGPVRDRCQRALQAMNASVETY